MFSFVDKLLEIAEAEGYKLSYEIDEKSHIERHCLQRHIEEEPLIILVSAEGNWLSTQYIPDTLIEVEAKSVSMIAKSVLVRF